MTDRELLRHTVATLAYRAAKTMRGAPDTFADFRPAPGSNTPRDLVAHMGDLFDWALTMAKDDAPRWHTSTPLAWPAECARFFETLRVFDTYLAGDEPLRHPVGVLFQGPIADALTHTGQLAMLRRLHGAPMKGESYARAEIRIGRVGAEQTPADPRNEFV
jgi:hypothetical protein